MIIPIHLCEKKAKLPQRAHEGDAGYDLCCLEEITIEPLKRKLIKTGVKVAIPINHYGRIAPRSGLALKHGIDVMAGVVDSSYRGEIGIVLVNLSDDAVVFDEGEKVAQLIIEGCQPVEWLQTKDLDSTKRQGSGYGSSDEENPPSISSPREVDVSNCLGSPPTKR